MFDRKFIQLARPNINIASIKAMALFSDACIRVIYAGQFRISINSLNLARSAVLKKVQEANSNGFRYKLSRIRRSTSA